MQEKIEKELTPYGCSVTNANISELRDTPGEDNRYFETLKTKAISAATQEARSVHLLHDLCGPKQPAAFPKSSSCKFILLRQHASLSVTDYSEHMPCILKRRGEAALGL